MRKLISVLLTVMILAVTFSVAVSAEIGDAINLAEDKPTEASSVWSGAGYEPDKAVDENPTTFWSNLYELEDDDGTWLIVDLEAKTVINTVTITERSALISRFGKWSIDVSDDGTTWKTVLSGIDDDIEVGADTTDATAVTNEFSFTAVETRYVRLSIPEMGDPSKTNMGLWEFGIYNIGNATVPAASEPAPAPVTVEPTVTDEPAVAESIAATEPALTSSPSTGDPIAIIVVSLLSAGAAILKKKR